MGNRQPIKQFKPSPRVGMNQGQNAGNNGQIVRPGTAGTAGGGPSGMNQNTINFKQPGPSSTKGFQGNQMYNQQISSKGFTGQNLNQPNAASHYLRGPGAVQQQASAP